MVPVTPATIANERTWTPPAGGHLPRSRVSGCRVRVSVRLQGVSSTVRYAPVSSRRTPDAQRDALVGAGCE